MFSYNRCPQDTDCYCPHRKDDCDAAKRDRVRCVHVEALMQATLALGAMRAIVSNTPQEHLVAAAIKEGLQSMGIAAELQNMA